MKKKIGKIAYSRIIKLDNLLSSGKLPPLSTLTDKLGVSQRTLERDIEVLRDYFQAPLYYNRKTRSYVYTDKNYKLKAISMNQEELITVLVLERITRLYAGTPFEPLIKQAFVKLATMLPVESCISVDTKNLSKAMVFEQGIPIREYSLDVFSTLLKAITQGLRAEISYYTVMGNREEGTRFIDPYHLANWGGEWYLIALCLRRKKVINFHLSRVKECLILDINYEKPKGFEPKKYIASGFGKIAGDAKEKIRLKIFSYASKWTKEKVWHFSQKFEKIESDGSFILNMDSPNDAAGKESLKHWILQFSDDIEVLEPLWLRTEIRKRLEKNISIYKNT